MRNQARQRTMFQRLSCAIGLVVLFASPGALADPVRASDVATYTEPKPKRLENIDVREQLGNRLPLDRTFADSAGGSVSLQSLLVADRPTIVTLNYANCPMLCSLQLNGLVEALKKIDWTLGKEYQIVTVSLDPEETADKARETAARYLQQYGRSRDGQTERGWHFVRGREADIRAVSDALGIGYGYNEERREYVHPAALAILSPEGRIMRYLYGIEYDPKTLRLSLVEAAHAKIGSTVERILLYCFHFDAAEGKYAPHAMNMMRLGGVLSAVFVGLMLSLFWLREWRRRRAGRARSHARSQPPTAARSTVS